MTATESTLGRVGWVDGDVPIEQVTRDVADAAVGAPTVLWRVGLVLSIAALAVGVSAVWYEFAVGVGTWGLNSTVGWAFDITNFVFWVGIGHAGTLISAILLLFRQRWRNAVNRSAEAMTLFAVACAGVFPIIHLGRPWLALWMLPYPNTRGPLWVNFQSPLIWDFFAISTYFTVSLVFWYVGLIPDLATLRDRTSDPVKRALYRFFALGWTGSHRVWHEYEMLYLLLAGLATPLVLSVHTVVSWDFGVSIIPGWHSTIFPPYFVAGAILSGLAMVLTLLIVARRAMRFEQYITPRHIEAMCKLIILTGGIIGLSYAIEVFVGLYSGNHYERFALINRAAGPLAFGYWFMVAFNVVVPQLFWFPAVRRNLVAVFVMSLLINVGMWFERFIIIVSSLERSYLESSWTNYAPTTIELAILLGSFGLFFTLFLLFSRFMPMISIAEVKSLIGHEAAAAGVAPIEPTVDSAAAEVVVWSSARREVQYLAEFDNEVAMLAAVRVSCARGIPIADVYTPCPVHGLSDAMGLPPSRLPRFCFLAGLLGVVVMTTFIFWTSTIDWPLNIGGKPWNALPAYIPVIFEAMVLWAATGGFMAFVIRSRLAPGKLPTGSVAGATDDRFVVAIERTTDLANLASVRDFFALFGVRRVTERRPEPA